VDKGAQYPLNLEYRLFYSSLLERVLEWLLELEKSKILVF
jgi:hypothetical protein